MAEEREESQETSSKEELEEAKKSLIEKLKKYKTPTAYAAVFIAAVLITSTVGNSLSGMVISDIESDCQSSIDQLESENTNLKSTISSRQQSLEAANVLLNQANQDNALYAAILNGLNAEDSERIVTYSGYEIVWDKYMITEPGKTATWFATIKNTDPFLITYTLDMKLKSVYNGVFDKKPSTGSLTLTPMSSGTLNVEMTPRSTGYAIIGLYVNTDYVGDMIVFSLD